MLNPMTFQLQYVSLYFFYHSLAVRLLPGIYRVLYGLIFSMHLDSQLLNSFIFYDRAFLSYIYAMHSVKSCKFHVNILVDEILLHE